MCVGRAAEGGLASTQEGYLDAGRLELLEEVPLEGHGHLEQRYDRVAQTTRVLKYKGKELMMLSKERAE